jgi:hypothetical protein
MDRLHFRKGLMQMTIRFTFMSMVCLIASTSGGRAAEQAVTAVIETSLSTAPDQIRQFAFDGDREQADQDRIRPE